jgi:hypothetical protein
MRELGNVFQLRRMPSRSSTSLHWSLSASKSAMLCCGRSCGLAERDGGIVGADARNWRGGEEVAVGMSRSRDGAERAVWNTTCPLTALYLLARRQQRVKLLRPPDPLLRCGQIPSSNIPGTSELDWVRRRHVQQVARAPHRQNSRKSRPRFSSPTPPAYTTLLNGRLGFTSQ